jgi:hypothetical protein
MNPVGGRTGTEAERNTAGSDRLQTTGDHVRNRRSRSGTEDQGRIDRSYMAAWLRRAVSRQKRRLTDSEFDLDLSYIVSDPQHGNVIAMGVPVSGTAGVPLLLPHAWR